MEKVTTLFEEENKIIDILLYLLSMVSIVFWVVIWIMHICALINAKLKLNNKRNSSRALSVNFSLRDNNKEKLQQLKHKVSMLFNIQTNEYDQYSTSLEQDNNFFKQNTTPNSSVDTNNETKNTIKQTFIGNIEVGYDGVVSEHQSKSNEGGDDSSTIKTMTTIKVKKSLITNEYNEEFSNSKHKTSDINCKQLDIINILDQSKPIATNETGTIPIETVSASSVEQPKPIELGNNNNSYISLPLPGVSILKPLVGVDKNLYSNLETFFKMDYPTYELLFCVQEPGDVAILIVEQLIKNYPNIDAKLFIGGSRVGVNPKINNMQPAYEAIKYELILISDCGILMKNDTLYDMVIHMNDNVALVHQMPFVCDGKENFQSVVERVYFGTAHARAYLTADLLNINCPTGMSALMRKCLLDEVGGIKAFGKYLAEDFFFAKSFTDRGWKICISSQPAMQNSANSSDTLSTLNSRIQRWIKLRFAMVPQWTILEPFSECMLLGFLGAISTNFIWSINPIPIFVAHIIVWFLFDYKLLCTIQGGPLTCRKTYFVAAWIVRECTALMIFLKALANPKVTWRSRKFKLKWGGFAEEISPEAGYPTI